MYFLENQAQFERFLQRMTAKIAVILQNPNFEYSLKTAAATATAVAAANKTILRRKYTSLLTNQKKNEVNILKNKEVMPKIRLKVEKHEIGLIHLLKQQ